MAVSQGWSDWVGWLVRWERQDSSNYRKSAQTFNTQCILVMYPTKRSRTTITPRERKYPSKRYHDTGVLPSRAGVRRDLSKAGAARQHFLTARAVQAIPCDPALAHGFPVPANIPLTETMDGLDPAPKIPNLKALPLRFFEGIPSTARHGHRCFLASNPIAAELDGAGSEPSAKALARRAQQRRQIQVMIRRQLRHRCTAVLLLYCLRRHDPGGRSASAYFAVRYCADRIFCRPDSGTRHQRQASRTTISRSLQIGRQHAMQLVLSAGGPGNRL